ncbi:MAG: thiamine pyrophosphate-dependent enzyme, partial [Actinomycetota bacterium]
SARIVVASSSMPIRDLEWYAPTGDGLLVYANRGANGIDGVVATAIGVASELGAVTAYLGDVAFVHDVSSLATLATRGLDVRIVVTNNDGGAIFSYLPQATSVATDTFEKLFGTPHGTDIAAVARGFGLRVATPKDVGALREALAAPGPSVIIVDTDRDEDHAVHGRLNAAISDAVDASLLG